MTDQTSVAADLVKTYLYTSTLALFAAGELVSFGHPGMNMPPTVIAWQGARGETDFATFTPGRTRDEDVQVDFTISCFEGGTDVAEKTVSDRANGYLRQIERLCRVTDPTLGGVALWAFLSSYDSAGQTDPSQLASGRTIEITGTISARVRIRN